MTENQPVLIETPYAGNPDALRYLACCILDSLLRGESPVASHALYPLALPEHCESYYGKTGREIGLERRDSLADIMPSVRYLDIGRSSGMNRRGTYLDDRYLTGEALRIWQSGEWPTMARLTHNHVVEAK